MHLTVISRSSSGPGRTWMYEHMLGWIGSGGFIRVEWAIISSVILGFLMCDSRIIRSILHILLSVWGVIIFLRIAEAVEHFDGQVGLVVVVVVLLTIRIGHFQRVIVVRHHSRCLSFLVLGRIIVADDMLRLAPLFALIFRSLLVDCILFFMETFQASEHDGRGLVAPCVCLLLDFEQERFKLVDVFVHRLFIQALL